MYPKRINLIPSLMTVQACLTEIERLDGMFRKIKKRAPKSELLYSYSGTEKKPIYGITLNASDSDEEEFFTTNKITNS